MGARTSPQMLRAQELLRQGLSAYAAAKESGISQGAISKCKKCRSIVAERKSSN